MSIVKRIRRINISMMLKLVSFIFLIPIIYLLIYSIMGYNGYIDFALKEKAGAEVLIKIKPLLFDIPKAKIGEKSINDKEIDKHFQELISEFDKYRSELGLSEEDMKKSKKTPFSPKNIYDEWTSLIKNNISDVDYNNIISKLVSLNTLIGDVSNLILDPDLDSYYLMDVTLLALPQTTVRMYENQYYVLQNIDEQNINLSDRINLSVFHSSFKQSDIDRINASMTTAFEQDEAFYGISNTLMPNLEPDFKKFNNTSEILLNETQKAFSTDINLNPQIITNYTSDVLIVASDLWDKTLEELITLLDIRIKSYQGGRLNTILIALFSVIIAYIAQFLVSKNITNLLTGVISFSTFIAEGEIDKAKEVTINLQNKYF